MVIQNSFVFDEVYVFILSVINLITKFAGELDDETSQMMSLPRCGVRDKVGFGESRAKRYALQGE